MHLRPETVLLGGATVQATAAADAAAVTSRGDAKGGTAALMGSRRSAAKGDDED